MNSDSQRNKFGNHSGTSHRSGKKQTDYTFVLIFAALFCVLLLALMNTLWSDSVLFQWLLGGAFVLLIGGAIAARMIFHVHIKTKQVVLWLTLISLAGTAFVGLSSRMNMKRASAAMVINGYPVSKEMIDRRARDIDQEIKLIRAQAPGYADFLLQMRGYIGKPRDIATRELIQERLLLSAADKMGLPHISPSYIQAKIDDPVFASNRLGSLLPPYIRRNTGTIDPEALNAYLKHQGISMADFEERIEDAIRSYALVTLLPSAAYTPQSDKSRSALERKSTRKFIVERFPIGRYIAAEKEHSLSDGELKAFYDEQNRLNKRYYTPEKRSGEVWVFTPEQYGLTASDVEIRRYYADHSKEYDKPLAQVKEAVQNKLIKDKFKMRFSGDANRVIALDGREAGAFDQFVEKRKGHKENLPWLSRNDAKKPLDIALFKIAKPGFKQVLFADGKGYIVTLKEVEQSVLPALSEVRGAVSADLREEHAWKALKSDLNARRMDLKFEKTETITVTPDTKWEELDKKGLPVDRMPHMIHPNAVIADINKDGGYCLVLSSIIPGTDSKEVNDAKGEENEEMSFFVPAFIASLDSSATIEKGGRQRDSGTINDEE